VNWGVFVAVIVGLLVLSLVGAALADRHARSRGYRINPAIARSLRHSRRQQRAALARTMFDRDRGKRADRPYPGG
jgi:hypothetical protein